MKPKFSHKPVLLKETINILNPKKGDSILDVTVGLGGHAEEFLNIIGKKGTFTAFDADKENLEASEKRLKKYSVNKIFIHSNFMAINSINLPKFDCILADLGLSSAHIDDESRGFTFKTDVPLDMRFDRLHGQTAAQWIYHADERTLALALSKFGEIKNAMRFAKAIKKGKPETTGDLRKIIDDMLGYKAISILPQIFQALRIAVNKELDALEVLLEHGPKLLKPNGRMAVISFHSLEDRMVKQSFRSLCAPKIDDLTGQIVNESSFLLLTKKPISPSENEIAENTRSRSAKLRCIKKR